MWWCHIKNLAKELRSNISMDRELPLKVGCLLPCAVVKQPSIPMIIHGRKWMSRWYDEWKREIKMRRDIRIGDLNSSGRTWEELIRKIPGLKFEQLIWKNRGRNLNSLFERIGEDFEQLIWKNQGRILNSLSEVSDRRTRRANLNLRGENLEQQTKKILSRN